MDSKFKELQDIIVPCIAAIMIMILGSLLNIENDIIQYLVTNVLPILIVTWGIIINKPSVYLKYFTFKRKSKNIKLGFMLKYCNVNIEDKDEYRNIINKFLDSYSGDIQILRQNIGSEVCITSFMINSVNYEIDYDDVDQSIILSINSQLNYKNFFEKISKAVNNMADIAGDSLLKFTRSFTKINLEFLNDNNEISNPFFLKIYSGFNIKSAGIKFKTKNNTIVQITNNCIIFTSDKNASELILDMKNIIFI